MSSSVEPGTILAGKYRVTKVLGEGGMGVVVAAVHIQLDEPVALKFMLPHALGSAEAVGRFVREARAAVKLKSEHVARVSDVGTLESGAPYIVMEYLDGTDLAGVLEARGPLPPEEAVDYILQACDALAEAHSLGIVHRDLKPANLFLTHRRDGSPLVKVLDFGISKSTALNEQAGESLTKTGAGLMGSPLYMSPEQMKSARTTDARTDIWALGVILYELVGGRAPFESDTLGGLMAQVLTEPPPPLPTLRPGLPPPLYEAIEKCLEKERDRRWSNVAELAMALGPVAPVSVRPLIDRISAVLGHRPASTGLEGTGSRASLATSQGARTGPGTTAPGWAEASAGAKPGSGKRVVAIGSGVAIAVAIAAIGAFAFRREAPPVPTTAIAVTAAAIQPATDTPHPPPSSVPPSATAAPTPSAASHPVTAPPSRPATATPSHRAPARSQAQSPSPQASASANTPQGNALFDGRR